VTEGNPRRMSMYFKILSGLGELKKSELILRKFSKRPMGTRRGWNLYFKKILNGWRNLKRVNLYLENFLSGWRKLMEGESILRKFLRG
jgi:hypothetical protein